MKACSKRIATTMHADQSIIIMPLCYIIGKNRNATVILGLLQFIM